MGILIVKRNWRIGMKWGELEQNDGLVGLGTVLSEIQIDIVENEMHVKK